MEFHYDYDDMLKCSDKLNEIMLRPITRRSLHDFYVIATNVQWQSASAEKFKEEVKYVICIIKKRNSISDSLKNDLLELANIPRRAACRIRELDCNISIDINELKF